MALVRRDTCPKCYHAVIVTADRAVSHVERGILDTLFFKPRCSCGCDWPNGA